MVEDEDELQQLGERCPSVAAVAAVRRLGLAVPNGEQRALILALFWLKEGGHLFGEIYSPPVSNSGGTGLVILVQNMARIYTVKS